jgi:hypothetical protein
LRGEMILRPDFTVPGCADVWKAAPISPHYSGKVRKRRIQ